MKNFWQFMAPLLVAWVANGALNPRAGAEFIIPVATATGIALLLCGTDRGAWKRAVTGIVVGFLLIAMFDSDLELFRDSVSRTASTSIASASSFSEEAQSSEFPDVAQRQKDIQRHREGQDTEISAWDLILGAGDRYVDLVSDQPIYELEENGSLTPRDDMVFTARVPVLVNTMRHLQADNPVRTDDFIHQSFVYVSQDPTPFNLVEGGGSIKVPRLVQGYVPANRLILERFLSSTEVRSRFDQINRSQEQGTQFKAAEGMIVVSETRSPVPTGYRFTDSRQRIKVTVPGDDLDQLKQVQVRSTSTSQFAYWNSGHKIFYGSDGRPCIWHGPAHGAPLDGTMSEVTTKKGNFAVEVEFLEVGESIYD